MADMPTPTRPESRTDALSENPALDDSLTPAFGNKLVYHIPPPPSSPAVPNFEAPKTEGANGHLPPVINLFDDEVVTERSDERGPRDDARTQRMRALPQVARPARNGKKAKKPKKKAVAKQLQAGDEQSTRTVQESARTSASHGPIIEKLPGHTTPSNQVAIAKIRVAKSALDQTQSHSSVIASAEFADPSPKPRANANPAATPTRSETRNAKESISDASSLEPVVESGNTISAGDSSSVVVISSLAEQRPQASALAMASAPSTQTAETSIETRAVERTARVRTLVLAGAAFVGVCGLCITTLVAATTASNAAVSVADAREASTPPQAMGEHNARGQGMAAAMIESESRLEAHEDSDSNRNQAAGAIELPNVADELEIEDDGDELTIPNEPAWSGLAAVPPLPPGEWTQRHAAAGRKASGQIKRQRLSTPAQHPHADRHESDIRAAMGRNEIRVLDLLMVSSPRQASSFARAQRICQSRRVAGMNDWRIPTIGELATLAKSNLVPNGNYWSNVAGDAAGKTMLVFDGRSGAIRPRNMKFHGGSTLCVRDLWTD